MLITTKVKDLFFDRDKVIRAVEKGTRIALARAGGLVRTYAIRSIPDRVNGASKPGNPPFSHVGGIRRRDNRRRKAAGLPKLRAGFRGIKHILFAYDPVQKSVVVGPISNRGGHVPNTLEFSGETVVKSASGRKRRVRIAARPFMRPALMKNLDKIPKLFEGVVRG